MKIPRYKIVSEDGLATGTKVIDLETGQQIRQVTKIVLRAEVNDLWRAEVHLVGCAVDVSSMASAYTKVRPTLRHRIRYFIWSWWKFLTTGEVV